MTTSLPKPHKPQTIRQAKAEYKKAGAGTVRLSATEKRRLERQVELDRRAQRIQYRERQRKLQHKRKHEHEQQERQARAILSETAGIGLATQLAGFNHTQVQMKRGMEAFLGIKKERKKEKMEKEKEGEERDAVAAEGTSDEGGIGVGVEDGDCNNDEGRTDDDEDISMPEMSCMAMLEDELNMATSNDEEGEGEDEARGKEEEIGERENKGDPWDIDELDDGTICTLIASAESSRERSSDSGKPGRLPPMTNSSFNISFSISDVDEAMFAARDDAERYDGGVSSAPDRKSGAETSEPPVDLLHKGMLELGDEFVASNSQILRELT